MSNIIRKVDQLYSTEPTQITNSNSNDQLIYFTSPCVTSDNNYLIFISDRTGNPNIFSLNLHTQKESQLTNNNEGYLKSYQYFRGNSFKGIGKASISLHPETGLIYYLQGNQICCTDLHGNCRVLARYPENQVTAYTHVSYDGTRLCVPTTDARVIEANKFKGWKPEHDIDQRIQEEKLNSYLHIYDTSTGKEIATEVVPQAWVTHVQFCPQNINIILYNHEWPSFDKGTRRLWIWDGVKHERLRNDEAGRSKDDWVCHEMWSQDGGSIIYHGYHKNDIHYIGKITLNNKEIIEIEIPDGFNEYGHFTIGQNGLLVSDGYYRGVIPSKWILSSAKRYFIINFIRFVPQIFKSLLTSSIKRVILNQFGINTDYGEWISIQKIDWGKKQIEWIPLCRHLSLNCRLDQDSHPHPVFNPNDDSVVYFTSNRNGLRAVYQIDVPGYLTGK